MGDILRFINKGPGGPVADGTQPPHDGGMEARVAKLEVAVEYIQRDVAEMRGSLDRLNNTTASIQTDLAVVKERLNHMPTTVAMWGAVAAVLIPIGAALWWIVQQYLGPILTKAAGG